MPRLDCGKDRGEARRGDAAWHVPSARRWESELGSWLGTVLERLLLYYSTVYPKINHKNSFLHLGPTRFAYQKSRQIMDDNETWNETNERM